MHSKIMVFVLLFCSTVLFAAAEEEPKQKPIGHLFADIIVQDGGRLKPFDTFARSSLRSIQGKQRFQGLSASDWLAKSLLDEAYARQSPVFLIRSPAVLKSIGVTVDKDHRYAFEDLQEPLLAHDPLIKALREREDAELDETEEQLVQVYGQASFHVLLSHALSCFWPDFQIDDPALAKSFGVSPGTAVSYYYVMSRRQVLRDVLVGAAKEKEKDPHYNDSHVRRLWLQLDKRAEPHGVQALQIIPPITADGAWRNPWQLMNEQSLTAADKQLMEALNQAVYALSIQDISGAEQSLKAFKSQVGDQASVGLEIFYNKADLFYYSLYLYIAAFIVLMLFWIKGSEWCYKTSMGLFVTGAFLHLSGVVLRCIIMERPPVSTLYEAIIFTSLVSVIFGFAAELWRKDTLPLLTALIIGISLQFIGFSYAKEGDTMGMLEAVLNSVFWLATHVITIIIGYGISLVAGIYGHILLARYIWRPLEVEKNQQIFKTARGIALLALFFTTLGTILGGIWADQSWGRFWGWDPKENGAMLIVLWLLIAIHGVISGELKQIGFACVLSFTNICVALAGFGVNLLAVGLHSYGRDKNTEYVLGTFCLIETILIIAATIYALHLRKGRQRLEQADQASA